MDDVMERTFDVQVAEQSFTFRKPTFRDRLRINEALARNLSVAGPYAGDMLNALDGRIRTAMAYIEVLLEDGPEEWFEPVRDLDGQAVKDPKTGMVKRAVTFDKLPDYFDDPEHPLLQLFAGMEDRLSGFRQGK